MPSGLDGTPTALASSLIMSLLEKSYGDGGPESHQRPFRARALGCLVKVIVVLVAVSSLTFFAYQLYWSWRANEMISELQSRGEPTSASELDGYYSLPSNVSDPAPLWLEATKPFQTDEYAESAAGLPIVGNDGETVPPPGEMWPLQEQAEQHLRRYARSLEKMHEAAEIGGPGRYPMDVGKSFGAPFEHCLALREGLKLLTLDAHIRGRNGDAPGAAKSLHAVFMAAESLALEPSQFSQLYRYAIL